jgi:hypothetical protein
MMGKAYRHLNRHESRDAQAGVPAVSRRVSLIIDLNGVIPDCARALIDIPQMTLASGKICVISLIIASEQPCGGPIRRWGA